jgi:dihydrofolate synthase / folylpolyglutamate synthase
MDKQFVAEFVNNNLELIKNLDASFFEITVALAFQYFAKHTVDIAVIEVGLGGLYDSTNIITPELCLITNIGLDHTNLLGNTIAEIAAQKAGIIKANISAVIATMQNDTSPVFDRTARLVNAPLYYADEVLDVVHSNDNSSPLLQKIKVVNRSALSITTYELDLLGKYQAQNVKGVLMCCDRLQELNWAISAEHIKNGLQHVKSNTGIRGRFDVLQQAPLVVCDVAHNYDGIQQVLQQVAQINVGKLHIVLGFVSDKNISKIISLLPSEAQYYCTQAQIPRALPYLQLETLLQAQGKNTAAFSKVDDAFTAALSNAQMSDTVVVIGSFFILAEMTRFVESAVQ